MDTKKLKYFLAVVEAGSITRAAGRIPVAQPALTRQIRLLEEQVGARLLERDRKGVSLTHAGQFLYDHGRRLMAELDSVAKKARAISDGYSDALSIGITTIHSCIPSISNLISRFRAEHPSIRLALESMLSGPQARAIVEGEIDAGILFTEREDDPRLAYLPIARYRMAIVASRRHPLTESLPTELRAFADAPFIRFSRDSTPGSYDRVDRCFHQAGIVPNTVQECHDDITIRSLVAAGMGYAIMPSIMARGENDLVAYELDDLPISSQLMLAWRKGADSKPIDALCRMVCRSA
ncbi:LysR family transcriptional regulator [Halomonas organivorans]|uniref:DNA-binding transcriptional LysR family regulator n=1 Tax=Halomonas organivorans TaxID=257772 RepID=A0A7W5C1Q2_9GAMM|nr:LysR family transcriptional regulator [Halomonas organivorans]MBB3143017.1 DNA-binding transcriptional LysR family regulator [Halomonas organivorans]